MRIAVCIVGFRNSRDIVEALEALQNATYRDFQVVICENGGEAAFASLSAAIPIALVGGQPVHAFAAPHNLGYAGGVNACLRATPDADAWWVLNPDTKPDAPALAALVSRYRQGDCDAVGCTVYFHGDVVESRGGRWRAAMARAESIDFGRPLREPPSESESYGPAYLSGASMLISRHFLETVGEMREDYFLYAEEVEWCLRARALGMRLRIAPEACVLHDQGSTTGSVPDLRQRPRMPVYLDERNKLHVTRDCFPALFAPAAAASLLLILLRFGRRGAWRQVGYAMSGWMAGVRNERGVPPWLETAASRGT